MNNVMSRFKLKLKIIKVDYDANISVQVNEKNEPAKTRETWIGKFDL